MSLPSNKCEPGLRISSQQANKKYLYMKRYYNLQEKTFLVQERAGGYEFHII